MYGRAMRFTETRAYNAALKQKNVVVGTESDATFTTGFRFNDSGFGASVKGRVGIDPTSGEAPAWLPDGTPNSSIVWSDYVDNLTSCREPSVRVTCTEIGTGTTTVFVEVLNEYATGGNTDSFVDDALIVLTANPACAPPPACNTPPQDADGDGDVDLTDFGKFQELFQRAEPVGSGNVYVIRPACEFRVIRAARPDCESRGLRLESLTVRRASPQITADRAAALSLLVVTKREALPCRRE